MKILIFAAAVFAAAAPALAATNVHITIGDPGFYGRINIGDFPQPQLVYAQPVIIQQPTRYVGQPIYLRVPPGHMKNWNRHCGAYNACGQQVYFVRDDWYSNTYAPHYRQQSQQSRDDGRGRDDDRGHDNGHGKGHDKHDKGHGKHKD